MTSHPDPKRGEVWMINFDPRVGAEIAKKRPAAIISVDSVGRLPLRVIVPITDWKPRYSDYPWFIHIEPMETNGLSKASGADAFQVKTLSLERMVEKVGMLTSVQMDEISSAIALVVGYSG